MKIRILVEVASESNDATATVDVLSPTKLVLHINRSKTSKTNTVEETQPVEKEEEHPEPINEAQAKKEENTTQEVSNEPSTKESMVPATVTEVEKIEPTKGEGVVDLQTTKIQKKGG